VGGESYLDVIERVRPIIIELERQRRSVIVVCHLAVVRCIYAYFMGTLPEDIPYLEFPKHRVIELAPGPFGCEVTTIDPATKKPSLSRSPSSSSSMGANKTYC
jgi:broad specificity phosphatase PhoE